VLGAKDFAGGLVVHMSSGFSALVTAIFLGKRQGYGREPMPPHSLVLTVIGAALLWVGWFGFNAGSALAANGSAALAFLTTQTATSAAVVTWVAIEWLHRKKPTVLGAASAAVAGLVAITPACGFVSPLASIAIGAGASVLCYIAITVLKPAWGYDDSLDVFGVHGVGGMWGALATGLLISSSALPEGVTWGAQVIKQLASIGITAAYSMVATLVILAVLRAVMGSLRVSEDAEFEGLDLALHSESAYADMSSGTLVGSGAHGDRVRESAAMAGVAARESAAAGAH
jgi:ammonium transporter, Amt family